MKDIIINIGIGSVITVNEVIGNVKKGIYRISNSLCESFSREQGETKFGNNLQGLFLIW